MDQQQQQAQQQPGRKVQNANAQNIQKAPVLYPRALVQQVQNNNNSNNNNSNNNAKNKALVPYTGPPAQQVQNANNNARNKALVPYTGQLAQQARKTQVQTGNPNLVPLYKGRNAANTYIPNNNNSKGTLATSLGVELADGKMHIVAPRDTPLPASITQTFSTADDNQTFAIIQVFEGEASNAKDNKPLGSFQLEDIPPMPRRQPRILLTFAIDERGRVSVTAKEKSTGATSGMGFRAKRSRLQQNTA